MALELIMPALSPTMEKGTLAKWLVEEGARIKPGDILAEIESDKATMELEAEEEGQIARLLVPAGTDDVKVGTVIALLAAAEALVVASDDLHAPIVSDELTLSTTLPAAHAACLEAPEGADQPDISPLARRLAAFRNVDVSAVVGSGPKGRIVRADLDLSPSSRTQPGPMMAAGETRGDSKRSRATEDLGVGCHYYLTARCRIDALLSLQGELNAVLADRDVELSLQDMLVKAIGLALIGVPDAHVRVGAEGVRRCGSVDISLAHASVAGGTCPVLRNSGEISLSAIATARQALQSEVSANQSPPDEACGTVSFSDFTAIGIDSAQPAPHPFQALTVGIAIERGGSGIPGEERTPPTVLAIIAGFDQRLIDDRIAVAFMTALREVVEAPLLLLS